ncbi:hypothetical protein EAI_07695, partial [Harpegnathos saltator]
ITQNIKTCYFEYFNIEIKNLDKPWVAHIICTTYYQGSRYWLKGKRSDMRFGIPMIWREPTDYITSCYFCSYQITSYNARNKKNISYTTLSCTTR